MEVVKSVRKFAEHNEILAVSWRWVDLTFIPPTPANDLFVRTDL